MKVVVFGIKSELAWSEIAKKLEPLDNVIAVRSDTVKSHEEIELAHHLAQKSMADGTNIARKLKYEFLLWLAAKTDIKSAMKASAPNPSEGTHKTEFLMICFGAVPKAEDFGAMREANLKEKADPLDLERISLSRIKG